MVKFIKLFVYKRRFRHYLLSALDPEHSRMFPEAARESRFFAHSTTETYPFDRLPDQVEAINKEKEQVSAQIERSRHQERESLKTIGERDKRLHYLQQELKH